MAETTFSWSCKFLSDDKKVDCEIRTSESMEKWKNSAYGFTLLPCKNRNIVIGDTSFCFGCSLMEIECRSTMISDITQKNINI